MRVESPARERPIAASAHAPLAYLQPEEVAARWAAPTGPYLLISGLSIPPLPPPPPPAAAAAAARHACTDTTASCLHLQGQQAGPGLNCRCGTPEEALCAEVLACLSGGWPPLPQPAVERRTTAAAASHSHSQSQTDSDCGAEDAECRPHKVRIVAAADGSGSSDGDGGRVRKAPARAVPADGATAGLLQRRTYTWRGVSARRAEKQQRQLDALQQQAGGAAAPEAAAVAALELEEASSCKEGARAWAALTTWLRMVRRRCCCRYWVQKDAYD